jgi:hypothetical protein
VRLLIISAALLLCGCRDQRPPAPSGQQSEQLNETEDMLNDLAANEEGPADRSASPSNQVE